MSIYFMSQDNLKIFISAYDKASAAGKIDRPNKSTQLKIDGDTAYITIEGVLLENSIPFLQFLGIKTTGYSDIRRQLETAALHPKIQNVQLMINSVGGSVQGYFETAASIRKFSKPINAQIADIGASAAYGLAASTDSITAKEWSEAGSVGVMSTYRKDPQQPDYIEFRYKHSQLKNLAPESEKGTAAYQKRVDQIGDLFFKTIAQGRNTNFATVVQNYGNGEVFLATEAKARGMIDEINNGITAKVNVVDNTATNEISELIAKNIRI